MTRITTSLDAFWQQFQDQETLSGSQLEAFKRYATLLIEWNERFNLTAITDLKGIIHRHFSDSLVLRRFFDLQSIKTVADIGSGAGFPIIPLKIVCEHLKVVLIEVAQKRREFLAKLIEDLNLRNVEICELDFRTFLRTWEGAVDLFIARASLDPAELVRIFKPSCSFKDSQLMYWAAAEWAPSDQVRPFVRRIMPYTIDTVQRKLVLMQG